MSNYPTGNNRNGLMLAFESHDHAFDFNSFFLIDLIDLLQLINLLTESDQTEKSSPTYIV